MGADFVEIKMTPMHCVSISPVMTSKCIEKSQMVNMGRNLLTQSTFSLFGLTLGDFVHACKIGFAKRFFALTLQKFFSEPLGKKVIFGILQKLVK